MKLTRTEWRLSALMTMVQIVGTLSFMIVMPLGPDLALDLDIPSDQIGWLLVGYTVASALAGITAAGFIDRFDRRPALAITLGGVAVANIFSAFAWNLETLVLSRVLSGLFGGPAAALSIAVVADNVPVERRGQAMGMVTSAISICAVIGVPLGLEISNALGWRAAFLSVAGLSLVIIIWGMWALGRQRGHLENISDTEQTVAPFRRLTLLIARKTTAVALLLSAVSILPGFMVITYMAVFVQFNLGFPRDQMGLLYMVAGLVSFVGMRLTGQLVDRFGSTPVILSTTAGMGILIWLVYGDWAWLSLPLMVLIPAFMTFNTARIVAQTAAVSKVPAPQERAGFMALVQTCTQVFGSLGALVAAAILETGPGGALLHMPVVAATAILISLPAPFLMWRLEKMIPKGAPESHRVKAAGKGADAPLA